MHVHILGICGTFMGGIAAIAKAAGHRVTGSDKNVYPPMSTQLEALGIELTSGFEAAQLTPRPDVVVVGNVMTRGVPVIEALLDSGIPYTSGPQWLAREVLRDQHVLAVAGTHGKTTTSSMLAWILEHAGLEPGFLIGGVPGNFSVSARLGGRKYFVIEADEYDTAFFDKRAKFVHYRPRTAILNNLEFDHADIYENLGAIQKQFHHLVRTIPASGRILWNHRDTNLAAVLAMGAWTPRETFSKDPGGEGRDAPAAPNWTLRMPAGERSPQDFSEFDLLHGPGLLGRVRWSLLGGHNAENALAAIAAANHVGIPPEKSLAALAEFRGVKRRLELRGEVRGVAVYDDFAHHPTAIALTIDGLRRKVGSKRIVAVLEPRSATMKMGVHRDTLAPSLGAADAVWMFAPPDLGWDADAVVASLGKKGNLARTLEEMLTGLTAAVRSGDQVLIMSNGGFGGLHGKLLEALAEGSAMVAVDSNVIALFPLHTVLFPGGPLPLRIFETRYTDMVRRCMREQQTFGVVLIEEGDEAGEVATTATVGCSARIVDFYPLKDGLLGISCLGERKFRVQRVWRANDGLNMGEIDWLAEESAVPMPEAYADLRETVQRAMDDLSAQYAHVERKLDDAAWVGARLAELLPISLGDKQALLELDDPLVRLATLMELVPNQKSLD